MSITAMHTIQRAEEIYQSVISVHRWPPARGRQVIHNPDRLPDP